MIVGPSSGLVGNLAIFHPDIQKIQEISQETLET